MPRVIVELVDDFYKSIGDYGFSSDHVVAQLYRSSLPKHFAEIEIDPTHCFEKYILLAHKGYKQACQQRGGVYVKENFFPDYGFYFYVSEYGLTSIPDNIMECLKVTRNGTRYYDPNNTLDPDQLTLLAEELKSKLEEGNTEE